MVTDDLLSQIVSSHHSYHSLVCTFGDSFNYGNGQVLNLETVLTIEEEQGTNMLLDGIIQLTRINPKPTQTNQVRLRPRQGSTKIEPFFLTENPAAALQPEKFGFSATAKKVVESKFSQYSDHYGISIVLDFVHS